MNNRRGKGHALAQFIRAEPPLIYRRKRVKLYAPRKGGPPNGWHMAGICVRCGEPVEFGRLHRYASTQEDQDKPECVTEGK